MKNLVRKWLIGDTVFREYAKIAIAGDLQQKVWLRSGDRIIDISSTHCLLCIEPLIFGVWFENNLGGKYIPGCEEYKMYFGGDIDIQNNKIHKPEAELTLGFFDSIEETSDKLLLLKLNKSIIHHLLFLQRYLIFNRYYKKDRLSYQRFQSFVSAYSYPRRIRIVSFRDDGYYNIFPMDLIGDISQHSRYVFGLRHTNVALQKIIKTGKLVVSEVPSKYHNTIYQLGKHHSSATPPPDALGFQLRTTKQFGFYVPEWVESYKEIKIRKAINMGSHMLLWGEQVGAEKFTTTSEHLYLVHFLHYLHQKNRGVSYTLA